MKHGFIAPVIYLDLIPKEATFHLLLAHLMSNKAYVDFYKKRQQDGDYIMIDNGAFEFHKPMDVAEYSELINKSGIKPNIVVAPDYPFEDWHKTLDAAEEFIMASEAMFGSDVEIMVVPQSKAGDWQGYLACYRSMLDLSSIYPSVTTIGVSILGVPNAFSALTGTEDITFNRTLASAMMKAIHDDPRHPSLKHHFLGCGDPREILMMKSIGLADTNDSSTAIWHGIQGIAFDATVSGLKDGKSKLSVDFFLDGTEDYVHPDAIEVAKDNIDTINSWL